MWLACPDGVPLAARALPCLFSFAAGSALATKILRTEPALPSGRTLANAFLLYCKRCIRNMRSDTCERASLVYIRHVPRPVVARRRMGAVSCHSDMTFIRRVVLKCSIEWLPLAHLDRSNIRWFDKPHPPIGLRARLIVVAARSFSTSRVMSSCVL